MSTLKIEPKEYVYVIDTAEDYSILYAPLHDMVVKLSKELGSLLSAALITTSPLNHLKEQAELGGILIDFINNYKLFEIPKRWEKRMLSKHVKSRSVVSLTDKCNLRCTYCYANTGMSFSTMSWNLLKDTVDRTVLHSVENENKCFEIKFHGGGEALVEWDLFKKGVMYIQEQAHLYKLHPHLKLVTNATLISQEVSHFLSENDFHLTVSFDGRKPIQDKQRPFSDGSGSFSAVLSGVKNLRDTNVPFELRVTVTQDSVANMVDTVSLASEIFGPKGGTLHFEPLSICGRAQNSNMAPIDTNLYIKNYLEAFSRGKECSVDVVCSFDTFGRAQLKRCGTSNCGMFCVTPTGWVSSCSRVVKPEDTGSDLFLYAQYNSTNRAFYFDDIQISRIREFSKLPLDTCKICFARWGCQGHCVVARYEDADYVPAGCYMVISILVERLNQLV